MAGFTIREDDLTGAETRALVALHLRGMHDTSPPEAVFALDLGGLQDPAVTLWGAWHSGRLAAIGALKMLGGEEAEVKSMRTHPDFLRRGAASVLLDHIIATPPARAGCAGSAWKPGADRRSNPRWRCTAAVDLARAVRFRITGRTISAGSCTSLWPEKRRASPKARPKEAPGRG